MRSTRDISRCTHEVIVEVGECVVVACQHRMQREICRVDRR